MERLQKVIANRGYASRRKAEELITAGKVKVNGTVVSELGCKVGLNAEIEIDGEVIGKDEKVYYLLYKPEGVISAAKDDRKRKTVIDLVPKDVRVYPVGRLDYDTSGVILLTNDGDLTNGLLHPSKKIDKTYLAKLDKILDGYSVKQLRQGIVIDDKKTAPAEVKVKKINKAKNTCLVQVTIHEGFNHQVKKMFETFDCNVLELKRIYFAGLDLEGLKKGESRRLTPKEVKKLYALIKD